MAADGSRSGSKRTGRGWMAALAAAFICIACASVNKYYDPAKPHHTPQGFRNNYLEGAIGGSFWKWQWERITQGLPKPPANGYRFPVERPDVALFKADRDTATAAWIGHATMLLQVGGATVLTDPIFSERASPLSFAGPQRKVPPALRLDELPHIDLVLISHNHYDHLDRPSIEALNAQAGGPPLFLVPLGLKDWMNGLGVTNARELDWWDKVMANGLELHCVPVQHWSARGLGDRFKTLWSGWAVKTLAPARPFSFFFAGDTGYSRDFADIGKRFGSFDLALIPIGAYEPRWFMKAQHVNPAEAVRIHRDIGARQSIGIHWGTFELTDEPLDEPPKVLARELEKAGVPPDEFAVLKHGAMMRF